LIGANDAIRPPVVPAGVPPLTRAASGLYTN
jgi:hypothetical protein